MKFLIIFLISLASAADSDWYKTASFYQIYPQTFYDGGGGKREGFGTFKGIQEKLPYIKELGIDCLWLTPVFKSSFNAFGYDITDYEDIDDRYGTKDDFKALINAVHANEMKIIVDFVPNHCGYEHEFFQKSLARDSTYENWFVWGDGKGENKSEPPSNWQRIGGPPKSGWNQYVKGEKIERDQFYYAQFSWGMPDLNLRNEQVIEYFKKFLTTWLEFGLDGFRVDAISHGFEFILPNGTFPDEAIVAGIEKEDDFDYLNHTYTQDQPELFELIYDWREILDQFNDSARIFMTESYSAAATVMKFYRNADGSRKGAQLPFNFQLIRLIKDNSTANDFVNAITEWFDLLPDGEVTNWAIGNHDQKRVATRFGTERVDIFNTLVTMLPGTSVTYYGEEIGMEDSCVYYNDDHNLPGFRCNATYKPLTDAGCRTPMQWSSAKNGGFTNSDKPWLPIGDKYETVNVEIQSGVSNSHLTIYKSLQQMRKHKAIKEGELKNFKIVKLNTNSFAFKRELGDVSEQSVIVLINYGSAAENVNLRELNLTGNPKLMTFKIVGESSTLKIDAQMEIDGNFTLAGYESVVGVYNRGVGMKIGIFGMIFVTVLRILI